MWFSMTMQALAAPPPVVEICSNNCDYDEIQDALNDQHTDLLLTDSRDYQPFTLQGRDFVGGRVDVTIDTVADAYIVSNGQNAIDVRDVDTTLVLRNVQVEGLGGSAIRVEDAALELDGVLLECSYAFGAVDGGGIWARNADIALWNSTVVGCFADRGGGIWLDGGALELAVASAIRGNDALFGGGLWARNAELVVPDGGDVWINGNYAIVDGGGLWLESASGPAGPLNDLEISANGALGNGGGMFVRDSELWLDDAFIHNDASEYGDGGGIYVEDSPTFVVTASRFDTIFAHDGLGGAIAAFRVQDVQIHDTEFENTRAGERGGAVALHDVGAAALERDVFCGVRANEAGAAVEARECQGCRIDNGRIVGSGSLLGGLFAVESGSLQIDHATVLDPLFPGDPVFHAVGDEASIAVSRSIVVGAGDALGGAGVTFLDVVSDADGPEQIQMLQDADPETLPCETEFRQHPDSPSVTLGAYEGPLRDEAFWTTDADVDGVPLVFDCDENDHRGLQGGTLPEYCDDLVDNDCDGDVDEPEWREFWQDADLDGYGDPDGELIMACTDGVPGWADNPDDCNDEEPTVNPLGAWWPDADGDGYIVWADEQVGCPPDGGVVTPPRREDCAPDDPRVHPGAHDVPDDGIDQDCNGRQPESYVTGGACQTGPSPGPSLAILLLTAALGRRRGS